MFSREKLLNAALGVALRQHYSQMTRADVAEAAGCSATLVSHYLGDMTDVREAVLSLARRTGRLRAVHAAPLAQRRHSGRSGPVRVRA